MSGEQAMTKELEEAKARLMEALAAADHAESVGCMVKTADLRTLLSALSRGDGWEPIETAPKNGTKFDAWTDAGRRIPAAWWNKSARCWMCNLPGEHYELTEQFTHWRPFPPVPEGEE